jgi:hypothetical protein
MHEGLETTMSQRSLPSARLQHLRTELTQRSACTRRLIRRAASSRISQRNVLTSTSGICACGCTAM